MLESVDNSILLGFVAEAQSYTPTIRQGIIDFHQDTHRLDEIQTAYRQVHTIKGAALMIGMSDLSELADTVETALETIVNGAAQLDVNQTTTLLAQLANIEILLDQAWNNFATDEQDGEQVDLPENFANEIPAEFAAGLPADFDLSLFDFSDGALEQDEDEAAASAPASPVAPVDSSAEPEDVDPEMLEIFALEAEEHLQIISANLQTLEHKPQDREALGSIRRSSHTLKGAAGVMGFRTTMNLAHRMEDLLDHLAEHPRSSDAQTTALLLAATDALERLSRGATAPDAAKDEVAALYVRFEQILSNVQNATAARHQSNNNSLVWDNSVAAAPVEAAASETQTPVDVQPAPELQAPDEFSNQNAGASAAPKTVVRVGLDRLDEMSKLVGEMIISRTVLEQRLKDIEGQLGEMRLSTNRLRKIAGKLEIDYEANQLQNSDFGMRIFGNGNNSFAVSETIDAAGSTALQSSQSAHGFDDLEFDRYTEFHQLTRQLAETSSDTGSITGELDDLLGDLDGLLSRQRRLSDDLQERMMRLRMVPLGTLATRLYRTVRVTADSEDKAVDLEIEGETVEVDTQVLNSLVEPLLHLLRNSVVHGIEASDVRVLNEKPARGTIKLRAFHEGTNIVLAITDDGRGMNPKKLREKAVKEFFITSEEAAKLTDEQALQLVFLPGFSTAERLNENAGRGVGMDIVRESVQRQQGTISIKSTIGEGTTMLIRLPMSLAVTRALLVQAHGQRFAIPLSVIQSLVEVSISDFSDLNGEKNIRMGDQSYPVHALNRLLELPALADYDDARIPTLLVQIGDSAAALTLDEVVEAKDIVIKPLEGLLRNQRGLLGSTILGDGSVVPILDLVSLIQPETTAGISLKARPEAVKPTVASSAPVKAKKAQLAVMIVDDSPSVRRVMTNLMTKTGWQTITAKDGLEAVELLQTARTLPDVILSDVEMPRMDGYELLATLKRQESLTDIPVVMITSRAGDKHRQRALDLGASDYVVKPYQDSVLLDTIKQLANE